LYEYADGIYVEDSQVRFYGFRIRTRMAVVCLPGRELLLYSPVWLTPSLCSQLDALGTVSFIVPPNKIHNLTLRDYRSAYPDARLYAPPGLAERRPELAFDALLTDTSEADWQDELDLVLTEGNAFFSEALLFHRRSRTLLVGDFVERIDGETASSLARALVTLWGVRARPMASPEFRFYTEDARGAARALDRARGWDIERIFLCHGPLIDVEAKAIFGQVCDRFLAEVEARGRVARWMWRQLARLQ